MGRVTFHVLGDGGRLLGGPGGLSGPLIANSPFQVSKTDAVEASVRRRLGYPKVVSRTEIQAGVWTFSLAWRRNGQTVRRERVTVAIVG